MRAAARSTARSSPASHTGRTGPCADRIIEAGIARVVAAMEDPFPLVRGRGFARLRAHGIQVDVGVERDAAIRLNQPFLTAVRSGPSVRHSESGRQSRWIHCRRVGRAHAR